MWVAAPTRRGLSVAAVALCLLSASEAAASVQTDSPAGLPAALWGVELRGTRPAVAGTEALVRLEQAGINTLVVDRRRFTITRLKGMAAAARGRFVFVVLLQRERGGSAVAGCRKMKLEVAAEIVCATAAPTIRDARRLANRRLASSSLTPQLVSLRVNKATRVRHGVLPQGSVRLLVLPSLRPPKRVSQRAWRGAVAYAAANPAIDLAAAPTGARALRSIPTFLTIVSRHGTHTTPVPPSPTPSPEAGSAPPPTPGSATTPSAPSADPQKPGSGPAPATDPGLGHGPTAPIPAPAPAPTTPNPPTTPAPPISSPGGAAVTVSVAGNDSSCARGDLTRPCASLNRAYQLANRGESVQILAGIYGPQEVFFSSAKESGEGTVTFSPGSGASVTIASIRFRGARNVALQGSGTLKITSVVNVTDDGSGNYSRNVTVDRSSVGVFTVDRAVADVTFSNGEIGPWVSQCGGIEDTQIGYSVGGTPPSNIVIANNYIHDMERRWCPEANDYTHTECIQIEQVNGMTIIGNTFERCMSDALLAKADFGPISNLTFESNTINQVNGDGTTPYAVSIREVGGNRCQNVIIRNNTFGGTSNNNLTIGCAGSGVGVVTVTNNVFASSSLIDNTRGGCPGSEAVITSNRWQGQPRYTCGSGVTVG